MNDKIKILVVDDNEQLRSMFCKRIKRKFLKGYKIDVECIEAGDVTSGLNAFKTSNPDFVVLDMLYGSLDDPNSNLEEENGRVLATKIKELQDVPMCGITAYMDTTLFSKVEGDYPKKIFIKPIQYEEIIDFIMGQI